jgi:hypothetical protein
MRVEPKADMPTYLKLKNVVHLVELLLVPVVETQKSAIQLPRRFVELNGSRSSQVPPSLALPRDPRGLCPTWQ